MGKYDVYEAGVASKDVKGLRESVCNICYIDRDFSKGEFRDAVRYIDKKIDIKDPHLIGKLVSEGKTSYTDEDFARSIFELKRNFCEERIRDVEKIGRTLYKNSTSEEVSVSPKALGHQEKKRKNTWVVLLMAIIIIVIFFILSRR